jgi:hypothetical protein
MTFAILPRVAFLVAVVCVGTPARAQEPVINVYFEPLPDGELTPLNKAIQAALSQPPLQLAAKPGAGVLVVTVPDKVDVSHKKVSGTAYSFTVAFSRDGRALGQSQQSCTAGTLSDCTDQLVLDVKSVAAAK